MESSILKSFVLTLDIDWAPDFILDGIADLLIRNRIKATWFVTHDSPGVRRLIKNHSLFDFGLHPNFLPNSTQGSSERAIMKSLRSILPDSKILRTHALYQSCRLLSFLVRDFRIETDLSLFLHETPNIAPHTLYFNDCDKALLRIPFFWEDDIEMCNPRKSWSFSDPKYHCPGLKVFDFHPMYIYLNCDTIDRYEELKKIGPLFMLDEKTIQPFINKKGKAVAYLFNSFLDFLKTEQTKTYKISDISREYLKRA